MYVCFCNDTVYPQRKVERYIHEASPVDRIIANARLKKMPQSERLLQPLMGEMSKL